MKMPAAKVRRVAIFLATVIIFGLAVYALKILLREVSLADVVEQLGNVSMSRVVLAVVFTAGSYYMLTFFDYFAVRAAGYPVPYRRAAAAALTAYGIGHTAGVPSLSGGSVRYRYYTPEGLSALEVAGIVTMVSLNFLLGVAALLGLSLVLDAAVAAKVLPLTVDEGRFVGVLLLVSVLAYLALTYFKREPLHIAGKTFQIPTLTLSIGQLFVSCADLCLSAATLYILIPAGFGVSFPAFVGVYVVAMQAGVLSNVPGGLGVFESVFLLLLPGTPSDAILGAMVLYRLIYYILPFIVATVLFIVREFLLRDGQLRSFVNWLTRKD